MMVSATTWSHTFSLRISRSAPLSIHLRRRLLTILSLNGKLPTGLIVSGPNNNTVLHFPEIVHRLDVKERAVLIDLSSEQCPNLKTSLKFINQQITNLATEGDDEMVGLGRNVFHSGIKIQGKLTDET